jgi:2,3,4,5-tetrahydropyridine-2,6-dicarboxylate N-succinyltransferase
MDTLCAQTGQGEERIEDRGLLEDEEHREAVFDTVAALDRGELRVAQKEDGEWRSNAW